MKKIFTLDDVMVSFIAAIGYGFGYIIPETYGLNTVLCFILCFAVGMALEEIAEKIIFDSRVQQTRTRRYLVFSAIAVLFVVGYIIMEWSFAHSLWEELSEELVYSVVFPVVGFFFSMGKKALKKKKLLKKYGTGESGFQLDENVEKKWKDVFGTNAELSANDGKNPAVRTISGTYVGKKGKDGVRFLGIPYASAERWKKPVPAQRSERIREAFYFGNSEIQPEGSHNILNRLDQGEDCLNLNIWTAKLEPEAKKPVLVYFHGGDGRYGGSANPVYHLENLAKAIPDGVFVSINFRFGVFGVVDFSSTGCPDAAEYPDSTALPLLDQLEALKWIKANIAAFGGDPENITVAGDTFGGTCICLLASMEQTKGLFRRAMILCTSSWDAPVGNEIASTLGKHLVEEFHAGSVADLQALTPEQLRDFSNRHYGLLELPPQNGMLVPRNVDQAYRDGMASGVEFIFGIAQDDASAWQAMLAGEVSLDDHAAASFESFLKFVGDGKANQVEELLQKRMQSGMSMTAAKTALMADFLFKACPLHDCRILSQAGSQVRFFHWDVQGDIEKLTANTASLVTAILGNTEIAEQMGYLQDKHTTEIMQTFVDKFMHGSPLEIFNNEVRGVSKIAWNEFEPDREFVLNIQKDNFYIMGNVFSENVRALERTAFVE